MNVTNAGHRIQESDVSGPSFNLEAAGGDPGGTGGAAGV